MSPEDRARLTEVVCDAMELDAPARSAFVARALEDRPDLVNEAIDLLGHSGRLPSVPLQLPPPRTLTSRLLEPTDGRAWPDFTGRLFAGRHRAEEPLGRGGFAAVYRGTDLHTGRSIAIKLQLLQPGDDPTRLDSEVSALRHLDVAGVVPLLDDGFDEGTHFLVMPLIDGQPFPGCATPAPWAAIAPIVARLFDSLAEMHAAGVVHGDLKPSNVIVDGESRPTVIDFGISAGSAAVVGADPAAIRAGTPEFMAPERWIGTVGPASDVFAAGLLVLAALTGRAPALAVNVKGPASGEAYLARWDGAGDVPARVRALVDAMTAHDANLRPTAAYAASVVAELGESPVLLEVLSERLPGDGPYSPAELEPLFGGPERLFHLRTDGAAELHARTHGVRAAVLREVAEWCRSGDARLGPDGVVVRRETLDRLQVERRTSALGTPIEERLGSARELMRDGRVGAAAALVNSCVIDGRRRLQTLPAALGLALEVAIVTGTERAVENVLAQVQRHCHVVPALRPLEMLARVARMSLGRDSDRALALASALGPMDVPELEQVRQSARMMAARSGRSDRTDELLPEIERWAEVSGLPEAHRQLATCRAWQAYGKGEYDDAVRWHRAAAEHAIGARGRCLTLLNLGSALLETGGFAEACDAASKSAALAAGFRHPHYEARAEQLVRAASYRAGEAGEPDLDLVEAIGHVHVPNLEGLVLLNEGAVSWRGGDAGLARELTLAAVERFDRVGHTWAAMLARAFAAHLGHAFEADVVVTLTQTILDCPIVTVQLQAAALLGSAREESRAAMTPVARSAVAKLAAGSLAQCRDLVSPFEACDLVGIARPVDGDAVMADANA